MRCKKHLTDLSSCVGVCASCLRDRLFVLIAAQAQANDDRRKLDPNQPPIVFPRSVSPSICRQKSESAARNLHRNRQGLPDRLFHSTPQVGPTVAVVPATSCKKKQSRFSLFSFSSLFRSKSEKPDSSDPKISVPNSRDSWLSSIVYGRRKKQSRLFSIDESNLTSDGDRRQCGNSDRGMSPARYSNDGEAECNGGSSDFSSKQTPARTGPPVRRGGGRPGHARNVSGLAFCLSPLVRASPNRCRNQSGIPTDAALSGEARVPAKPHISIAASFCANRSRKLADFGRFNQNHGLR